MRTLHKVVGGARLFLRTFAKVSGKLELFHERQLEGVVTDKVKCSVEELSPEVPIQ